MKKELLIALVESIVDQAIKNHENVHESFRGPRGLRGRDGHDFDFEENQERISLLIQKHISDIKEKLKLRFEDLSEEDRASLKGSRGQRGKSGKDFDFEDSRKEIEVIINSYIESISDELKLKFSDLSEDEKFSLRGPRGLSGEDGKDFNFEDSKEEIESILHELVESKKESLKLNFEDLSEEEKSELRGPRGQRGKSGKDFNYDESRDRIISDICSIIEDKSEEFKATVSEADLEKLKLKFSDLSEEEKSELRGPRGFRGKDGYDFNFEDSKDEIRDIISSHIDSISESLKLGFEDLSEEEKSELRGPRGQRGKRGHDFVFEEHEEAITKNINSFIDSIKDGFKLNFDDLSEEEKDSLKLKFYHLTEAEKMELRGPRGQRGKQGLSGEDGKDGRDGIDGKDGRDGVDGKIGPRGLPGISGRDGRDAAEISEIRFEQDGDFVTLVVYFNDGTYLRTNKAELPTQKQIFHNYYHSAGSGGGGLSEITVFDSGVEVGPAENLNFDENLEVEYDGATKTATIRAKDPCLTVLDEGVEVSDCVKSVNFVGESISVEEVTVIGDWPDLEIVDSIGNWKAGNPSLVNVRVDTSNVTKFTVTKIANEAISKFDLINLDTETTGIVAKIDSYDEAVVAGMAIDDASIGEEFRIIVFGIVEDPSFSFSVNKPLFLNTDGTITDVAITTSGKFLTKIGKSYGSGSVFIDVNDPRGIA